jgi:hypothetical protein
MATEERDDDIQTNEREALRAMLASEGWQLYTKLVAQDWAPAVILRRIYAGDVTPAQIELTHKEVTRLMQLPAERVIQLSPRRAAVGPLEALRRTHRG